MTRPLLLQNRFYEAPPHLVGQRIETRFDPLDADIVDIYVDDRPEGQARVVDPVINAGLPRCKPNPRTATIQRHQLYRVDRPTGAGGNSKDDDQKLHQDENKDRNQEV